MSRKNRPWPKDYAIWMVDAWGADKSRDLVQAALNKHDRASEVRSWWKLVQEALPPPPPPAVPPPPTPAQVAERWAMEQGVVYQVSVHGIFIPFNQTRFGMKLV